jgi:hypothetical protein
MMPRTQSWGINNVTEFVAGNYYPITDSVLLRGPNSESKTKQAAQFAVLTDRAYVPLWCWIVYFLASSLLA